MHEGVRNAVEKVVESDLSHVDYIFHGTTAVINALIERDGATTGLLTTEGFRDVYELGRGGRDEPFNMMFSKPDPYVPRRRRFGVPGRIDGDGEELQPLDEDAVADAAAELVEQGVESIAVCYLNSYLNPSHETRTAEIIEDAHDGVYVTTSSDLVREWREFERTSTTVMNAYVRPLISRYVDELESFLASLSFDGELLFLQSNGGSMAASIVQEQPLALVESGPSAGIVGSAVLAEHLDLDPVVSFDMGGTTAKASLIEDHEPTTTRPYFIGGERAFPSLLPSIDIKEIGAGGGSVAYIDEGGGLKVGPRSAGAEPGPVCYDRGGTEPTVTDAHVVLGRIDPDAFLGGEMQLNVEAAREAIAEEIASPLGLSVQEAAEGILEIADNQMALLLREQTVENGQDPRNMSLIAAGGAGPLHATTIAGRLNIANVVVPMLPANFSAFGMLMSDVRHEQIQTVDRPLAATPPDEVNAEAADIESDLRALLDEEGLREDQYDLDHRMELCYEGQSHYVTIETPAEIDEGDVADIESRFHSRHEELYGFSAESEPIHLQSVEVVARGHLSKPDVDRTFRGTLGENGEPSTRDVVFDGEWRETPIHSRSSLARRDDVRGPAIVEDASSTVLVQPGDVASLTESGSITIEVGADE